MCTIIVGVTHINISKIIVAVTKMYGIIILDIERIQLNINGGLSWHITKLGREKTPKG